MKKLFLTMLLLVVLTFGAAQTCLAANVPVYLDGERVTTGLERGGYTYLPLRSMFETVGGAVEWEEKTQTITAYLPDGGILTMQIGSKTPEVVREKENSIEHSRYELEQAAFISRGITYVPLRFITETLLQYDLDWRNNAVWLTSPKLKYTLSSGEVFKLDQLTGDFSKNGQLLGKLDLPSLTDSASFYEPFALSVQQTPAGNYLVQVGGIGSGSLSFDYDLNAYVPAAGQSGVVPTYCVHTIMIVDLPEPFVQGENIWISDDEIGAVCINDKTGAVTEYKAAEIYQYEYARKYVWWANERFILWGDGASFDLYDKQSGTLQNMEKLLVTPEVKAEAEAFLQANTDYEIKAENFELYWQYLSSGMPMGSPTPDFSFSGAEGNELHFRLFCRCRQNIDKEFLLVYQLPE